VAAHRHRRAAAGPPHRRGRRPAATLRLVDNEYTWLDSTDLVFIDPVGTGYSRRRPAKSRSSSPAWKKTRVGSATSSVVHHALPALAQPQIPRGRKLRHHARRFPERAPARRARHQPERHHPHLDGPGLPTLSFGGGTDLPYLVYLPSYTATAFHFKKLAPELQTDLQKTLREVEAWATTGYVEALARGTALEPAKRAEAVKRLARYTGLTEDAVDKAELRIDPELFRTMLLEDRRLLLGRFDARMTGFDRQVLKHDAEWDPSYSQYEAAYSGAFNDYVRRQLKFESDLKYEVLTGRVHPWNFGPPATGTLRRPPPPPGADQEPLSQGARLQRLPGPGHPLLRDRIHDRPPRPEPRPAQEHQRDVLHRGAHDVPPD
jgi:hypothetical protein